MNAWVIETIEREAMDRASRNLALQMVEGGDTPVLFGLSTRQILALKHDWETRTGKLAKNIEAPDTGLPVGMGRVKP